MRIPMPSPHGTNRARLFVNWPVSHRMAMDAAPRSRRARDEEDMPAEPLFNMDDTELDAEKIEALGKYLVGCGVDRDDIAAIIGRLAQYGASEPAGEDNDDPDAIERAGLTRPVSARAFGGDRRGLRRRAMDASLHHRAADRDAFARRFPDAARVKVV